MRGDSDEPRPAKYAFAAPVVPNEPAEPFAAPVPDKIAYDLKVHGRLHRSLADDAGGPAIVCNEWRLGFLKSHRKAACLSLGHRWRSRVDPFEKLLADAQRSREEAVALLSDVHAGTARLASDMTRERAVELLNGSIGDYNTIIKRLGGRHRG